MKLSILIPSRNMADEIDQFFEYIYCGADETEFECVVVDSSTDDSMNRFEKWQKLHSNLKVLHYPNQIYCGTARNIAAKNASGDYIYCMDIDDRFFDKDALKKVLQGIDGKDIYYCPYSTAKVPQVRMMPTNDIATIASAAVGCWDKLYRKELYVDFPDYMPEDVVAHYLLIDKCRTVGSFQFPVYFYNNKNPSAISRTFDYLANYPHNLLQLALTPEIEQAGIRQEFIVGVIHNLADMFSLRDRLKQTDVKSVWAVKLRTEYSSFMSGFLVH